MTKRLGILVLSGFLLLNICGCFALFAGAVGGAGTAYWLSGKLTQQFNASYDRTVQAAEAALRSFNYELTKESKEAQVTQLRSKNTEGKDIWIDVRKVSESSTRVDVRVGAVSSQKDECAKILDRIKSNL